MMIQNYLLGSHIYNVRSFCFGRCVCRLSVSDIHWSRNQLAVIKTLPGYFLY